MFRPAVAIIRGFQSKQLRLFYIIRVTAVSPRTPSAHARFCGAAAMCHNTHVLTPKTIYFTYLSIVKCIRTHKV